MIINGPVISDSDERFFFKAASFNEAALNHVGPRICSLMTHSGWILFKNFVDNQQGYTKEDGTGD